jgi:hypothetical protein
MSVRCHLGYPTRSQRGNFLTYAPWQLTSAETTPVPTRAIAIRTRRFKHRGSSRSRLCLASGWAAGS